jgi:hypothetical protein
MSLTNNLDQNRPGTGFRPVVSSFTTGTVERRGLVLTHADELLQIIHQLLRMTIELLQLLQMTLDEIWCHARATHLKPRLQQL